MIRFVRFENFRGFRDHVLPLKGETIIVGANNAGKSTVVEALRLVSLVANRYKNLNFAIPPRESNIPMSYRVVSPSLVNFNINFDNLFHNLGDPPAVITAEFETGERIEIYLVGHERLYASIFGSSQRIVRSKAEARQVNIPEIHILPQVAPLAREETVLNEDYVRANMSSALAPLHFRNQLRILPRDYTEFRQLAAQTWPGMQIVELIDGRGWPGEVLALLVSDGSFTAEVAWMGHGLQMWLQTVWFLARTPKDAITIFDEPDVYLHPDLQRRLIRLIRRKYRHVVVATHSTEIMSEVDPTAVLIIDRTREESQFADDHPALQRIVDHIGSSHNISLARLRMARRFILIEGKDMSMMSHLHSLLFPNSPTPIATIPNVPIGGWGGWDYAIGSMMAIQNYADPQIVVYCLLDCDDHSPGQISDRYDQAAQRGIELHVWTRKEIENYLLVPSAIRRVIEARATDKAAPSTTEELTAKIDELVEDLRQEMTENFGNEFLAENRRGGFRSANKNARDLVNSKWQTRDGRWSCVGGKRVLSRLSEWTQQAYGVSFGPLAILRELRAHEIPREVVEVIRAIEGARPLAGSGRP